MEIILENIKSDLLELNCKINSIDITGLTGINYKEALNILSLNIDPKGSFIIDKVKINKNNRNYIQRKISFVEFELRKEYSIKTIKEYMEYIMQERLIKVKDSNKKIKDSLRIVGLNQSYLDKDMNILSKSEIKLVQIAISLLSNPDLIILDDPFKFLDTKNSKKLYMLLLKLKEQYNKLIIIGSNDSNILYKYTTKMIFLKNCKVLIEGNTKELYERVSFLNKNKFEIPEIVKFTYKAKQKKVKIEYHRDIRDIIKDIYKHV